MNGAAGTEVFETVNVTQAKIDALTWLERQKIRKQFYASPEFPMIQRKKLLALRKTGIRTMEDVKAALSWMKDPVVGTKVNCGNPDHCAPLDFLFEVLTEQVLYYIAVANRSGSKSYLAGLITWIGSGINEKLETTILGGSLKQSENSYKAMNDFWKATNLIDEWLLGPPMRERTKWRNGSIVSVLTASTRSTRGPHPQRLIMDEIDEMDIEVYESALSQPQSKHGLAAGIGKLSTNHRIDGTMDRAIAKAKETGVRIFRWCIWESIQSCRDYSCSTCKLSPWCPGEQIKRADGYYSVADFIAKLADISLSTLYVEWLCIRVGRSDLIYGDELDERLHAPTTAPDFNDELPAYVSIDWGGTSPFTVGVWQAFRDRWWRVDEVYTRGTWTNTRLIAECKTRAWWKNVPKGPNTKGGVADPNRTDLIQEWIDEGVRLEGADNAVDMGIESVRNALKPLVGDPKIGVNPRRCKDWLREIRNYHQRGGKPVKADDHTMDDTRYFVRWKIKASSRKGRVGGAGAKTEEEKGGGSMNRSAEKGTEESEKKTKIGTMN